MIFCADVLKAVSGVSMKYVQRLWRAELIGLMSLIVVSVPVAIILVFFFDLGPNARIGLPLGLQVFASTYSFGFMPVATYGAPIFAVYLFNPAFRLAYLLGFAALPGFVLFLVFGSDLGLGLIPYGLAVALTMCGIARLWLGRLGGEAT